MGTIRLGRDSGPTMSAGRSGTGSVDGGASTLVSVTLDPPQPDFDFTAVASVVQGVTGDASLRVLRIRYVTATAVNVNVVNDSLTAKTGTVHVIALHD